ncbi:MAG: hypothetical protein IKT27_00035 [Clostridia bacterium]|nr:hypothetical protein [Clostridia bacterium]
MKKVLPSVFLIVGSIIGAGFASGRELSLFFAEFGYNSLYFLPIVFILFYYCFKFFLTLGAENQFQNVFDINKKTNSSAFFNIAIFAIFLIYGSAMFSGAVEVLANNFIDVPVVCFVVFVFLLAYCVLRFGLGGLVKINAVAIPIIIILLIIYAVYSTINPITQLDYIPNSEQAYILPVSIVIYVFANILLSYFILVQAGQGLTKKEIQKSSLIASLIICFAILICIICLIENGAVVMDASMPFVVLTLRLGDPFPLIFMAVLFLGIITSLFSCLHTLNSPFAKSNKKTAFKLCVIVALISLIGFQTIVNYCYPVIGLFGVIVVFRLIKATFFPNGLKASKLNE